MRAGKLTPARLRHAALGDRVKRSLTAVGLAAAAALFIASAALLRDGVARAQAPLEPQLTVRANSRLGTVSVALLGVPGARCGLRISDEGWTRAFPAEAVGSGARLSWRLAAPRDAAKAPWDFDATCRLGLQWGWRSYVAELGFPRRGGALAGGLAPGSAPGLSCDSQGVCFADDPFEVGQCGWYGLGRRSDLRGIVGGRNAGEWLGEASGLVPEGYTPRVGALAVWSIASDPPHGHVGYVAAVKGSKVLIDDSNWRPTPTSPPLQIHEHWVSAAEPTAYIYRP